MEHIKMAVSEEKNAIVYKFSLGYEGRGQELKWVNNVITAKRSGDKWAFDFSENSGLDAQQFEAYRKMLEKVNQVVETNGMNLMGITIDKVKPAQVAAQ